MGIGKIPPVLNNGKCHRDIGADQRPPSEAATDADWRTPFRVRLTGGRIQDKGSAGAALPVVERGPLPIRQAVPHLRRLA